MLAHNSNSSPKALLETLWALFALYSNSNR